MGEIRKELKVFSVDLECVKCGKGVMIAQVPVNPANGIPHDCSACKTRIVLKDKQYPCVEYKDKAEVEAESIIE